MGLTSAHTREMLATPERRQQLRRLDDMLELLEQLNLHEITEVPEYLLHRLAEEAAFGVLDAFARDGNRFNVISEEAGPQDRGAEFPLVFVDPIDGSLNAKQGIPLYSAMLSVLDGPDARDILAGYVINL